MKLERLLIQIPALCLEKKGSICLVVDSGRMHGIMGQVLSESDSNVTLL